MKSTISENVCIELITLGMQKSHGKIKRRILTNVDMLEIGSTPLNPPPCPPMATKFSFVLIGGT